MKKLLSTVMTGFLISLLIIGCNETSKKDMTDANLHIKDANQNMKEAIFCYQ